MTSWLQCELEEKEWAAFVGSWDAELEAAFEDMRQAWTCLAQPVSPRYAPSLVEGVRWLSNLSQREEAAKKFARGFATVAADVSVSWPETLQEAAIEWFGQHLNAGAVEIVCGMAGVSSGGTKQARVRRLVEAECPLVTPSVIKAWARGLLEAGPAAPSEVRRPQSGERDVRGNERPTPDDGQPSVSVADIDDCKHDDGVVADTRQGTSQSAGNTQAVPGSFTMTDAQLQMLLSSVVTRAAQQTPDPGMEGAGASAVATRESGLAAYLRRFRTLTASFGYVDPIALCVEQQEQVKRKQSGRGLERSVRIADDLRIISGTDIDDVRDPYDPTAFRQGMDVWLRWIAELPETKHRIADILRWNEIVWAHRSGSPRQKVLYMKEFMLKYQGVEHADDWAGKFGTDFALMNQFLQDRSGVSGQRMSGHTRGAPRNPTRGITIREKNLKPRPRRSWSPTRKPRRRGDRRSRSPPTRRGTVPRATTPAGAVCYSRTDPAEPDCNYARCRFSHKCISCGEDHPASKCKKWDAAKARAWRQSNGRRY